MSKEIFMELISQVSKGIYTEALVLLLTYFSCWYIALNLGYRILNVIVAFKRLTLAILAMTFNSLFIKPNIPASIYGPEMTVFVILFLKYFGRVSILRAACSAIIISLCIAASDSLIATPLMLNKGVAIYFKTTVYGNCILSAVETLIQAILLLILTYIPIPMIPPFREKKINKMDVIRVLAFGSSFYLVYCALMRLLQSLLESPKHILSNLIAEFVASVSSVVFYFFIYLTTKKESEEEQRRHEEEQQRYEEDRRMNELKIQKLKEQNQTLQSLVDELQSTKITPQEFNDTISKAIVQFQNTQEANLALINQLQPPETPDENFERKNVYLSPREIEVLSLVGQGRSNQEIAIELKHKESYIKNIVSRLYDRLDIHDRAALAVYATRAGYSKLEIQ
jgi:DNA-binding CsgD family transcriptional regulator